MKTIYKYPLEITDRQVIEIPAGSEILSAQMQRGQLCLWVLVHTYEAPRHRDVYIFGTGNPIPQGFDRGYCLFVGTVQQGPLVWHIFIEK